jgi:aminodeoxyfutalosine synthase
MTITAKANPDLATIVEKVNAGERLTLEDGLALYASEDLLTIAQLANQVNRQKNGDRVYFIQNMYINPPTFAKPNVRFAVSVGTPVKREPTRCRRRKYWLMSGSG